ncbi:MAG: rRNA maturation RNase YbeY [Nitrospira sp.]|nr:rRNA maturation RNase YbeY [bacterium]MBL7050364.1 rRNA maturation RNase YbeY [Nitrospira sp.]
MKALLINQQRSRPIDREIILTLSNQILKHLNQSDSELSVLLVGNKKMQQLNSMYRGKNKPTDVLSFPADIPVHNAESDIILGDIVICIPRAEAQAEEYGWEFYEEISRLLIHGTLHLMGYDHELSESDAKKMIRKEQETMNAVKKMDQER